jgi:DNA-binding CsgD family transcriptional regulator
MSRDMVPSEGSPEQDSPGAAAGGDQIRELLRRRARARVSSSRWNGYTLVFAYSILALTIILAIRSVSIAIVAVVAAIGLLLIWGFSFVQARKLEAEFFREELRVYTDLLSTQPKASLPPTVIASEETQSEVSESPLTDRELQVLRLVADGRSNKETALALRISDQTVKNHISHIFSKLNVNDRTSAVLTAIDRGWLRPADLRHSRSILDKPRE